MSKFFRLGILCLLFSGCKGDGKKHNIVCYDGDKELYRAEASSIVHGSRNILVWKEPDSSLHARVTMGAKMDCIVVENSRP